MSVFAQALSTVVVRPLIAQISASTAAARKWFRATCMGLSSRHLTWFRKEPLVHWLPGFGVAPAVAAYAEKLVTGHLRSSAAP
jgi:hypothetical protein